MKFLNKYNLVCGVLFVYATGMFLYFFPRNHEMSDTEKWTTVGVSYAIIILLWFVLRKRNKLQKKREEEL